MGALCVISARIMGEVSWLTLSDERPTRAPSACGKGAMVWVHTTRVTIARLRLT